MRRSLRPLASACVLALSALLASCSDQPSPTGPAARTAAPVAPARPLADAYSNPSTAVGSFSMQVPATNDNPTQGGLDWAETGIVIPDGSWVRIEVSGAISISKRPGVETYCSASNCFPYDGQTAGPGGVGSPAMLAAFVRLVRPAGTQDLTLHRPSPETPTIYLTGYFRYGGRVQVKRTGLSGGASVNNYGYDPIYVPYYNLSGQQTLTVTPVQPPQVRPNRLRVAPNDSVVFSVTWPYPQGTNAIYWSWRYDDTTATPQGPGGDIWACYQKTSCTVWPIRPIRLYATYGGPSVVEAVGASPVVWTSGPTFTVQCDSSSLTRGSRIKCTGQVTPAAAYRVTDWQFVETGGAIRAHQVNVDKAAGEAFEVSGQIVVPGTVRMSIIVGGVAVGGERTAEGSFTVVPRTWPLYQLQQAPDTVRTLGRFCDKYMHPDDLMLGRESELTWGCWIAGLPTLRDTTGGRWNSLVLDSVASGPNEGYKYVAAPIQPGPSLVVMSPALQVGSVFESHQHSGSQVVVDSPPYCSAADVGVFRNVVAQHEGAVGPWSVGGAPHPDSHEAHGRTILANAHVERDLEKIVGFQLSRSTVTSLADAALASVKQQLGQANYDFDTAAYGGRWSSSNIWLQGPAVALGCDFRESDPQLPGGG